MSISENATGGENGPDMNESENQNNPQDVAAEIVEAVVEDTRDAGVSEETGAADTLLREPDALPEFFWPLAPKLIRLRALAAGAGVPLPAALLLFAAYAPGVARAVIGVDSVANLHENLAAAAYLDAAQRLRPALAELAEPTDHFILPYAWPPRP